MRKYSDLTQHQKDKATDKALEILVDKLMWDGFDFQFKSVLAQKHFFDSFVIYQDEEDIKKCILNIAEHMRFYQKEHNVKRQCLANVSYLMNTIQMNFPTFYAKAITVLVVYYDKQMDRLCNIIHVVIDIGDSNIIDPSYEVNSIPDTDYCLNFKVFKELYGDRIICDKKLLVEDYKKVIKDLIEFDEFSKKINSGEFLFGDKKFYNDQADYIDFINMVGGF